MSDWSELSCDLDLANKEMKAQGIQHDWQSGARAARKLQLIAAQLVDSFWELECQQTQIK